MSFRESAYFRFKTLILRNPTKLGFLYNIFVWIFMPIYVLIKDSSLGVAHNKITYTKV